MLCRRLWLHLGNALDLALQNQKPLVIQIYSPGFEQRLNFAIGGSLAVDSIFRAVVAVRCPRDN